jgi:dynein intermediate chain 1, axonemal
VTKFSFKDRAFKTDDIVEQMTIHFALDGDLLQKDSEEARDQDDFWDQKKIKN